jgi:hypothetical protein
VSARRKPAETAQEEIDEGLPQATGGRKEYKNDQSPKAGPVRSPKAGLVQYWSLKAGLVRYCEVSKFADDSNYQKRICPAFPLRFPTYPAFPLSRRVRFGTLSGRDTPSNPTNSALVAIVRRGTEYTKGTRARCRGSRDSSTRSPGSDTWSRRRRRPAPAALPRSTAIPGAALSL